MSTSQVTFAVAHSLTIADSDLQPAQSREAPRVQALVDAARAGDREAFGELVVLHERLVFRTSLAALGHPEDAEDAAQEAFVMAWRKLPGFRGDSTFRTWLLTIVWRKALDRRRVRTLWLSRTRQRTSDDTADPLDEIAANLASPEQDAVSRDLARRIRAEILRLSPKIKDAFLLATSGDYSYDEIGALLRIPVGTVKWRVSEARRILQQKVSL
jgi:RNA polymerase sigma-70 factor (ECF subfamily)